MIAWLKYRKELRRLEGKKRSIQKAYSPKLHQEFLEGSGVDRYVALVEEQGKEISKVDDEISETTSFYLAQVAHNLNLPAPAYDSEAWEVSHGTGLRHLTLDAMAALQMAIRSEKKDRLQLWELRAKIAGAGLAGLTGAIGALIGLVAIFKK